MDLAARWPLPELHEVRDRLLTAYAEPSRYYHDRVHLIEVLDRLDELATGGESFPLLEVELAAWFHDAVYDGRAGAEERSAELAERSLRSHDAALAAEVARLVRVTETHRPCAGDGAAEALVDADLAILASPQERYAAYAAAARREYAHVPDLDFAVGRRLVLEALLAKPSLFHTAYARGRWEAAARANLSRELAALPPRTS